MPDVQLVDGPGDGTTVTVGDPWPRDGYIQVVIDLDTYAYAPQTAGPPYYADYVDFDADTAPDEDAGDYGEGPPGPEGPPGTMGPPGPQGEQGPPGPAFEHQGDWDIATTYAVNDTVLHDGSLWLSLTDLNTGNEPGEVTSAANWAVIAQQGAAGPEGPPGPAGAEGPPGAPGSPLPAREQDTITTASLAADAAENGTVTLATGYRILRAETNRPAWVRLYTTATKRTADQSRLITDDPSQDEDHGVVVEVVTSSSLLGLDLSPVPQGYSMETTPTSSIPYRIVNLDSGAGAVTVELTWQPQET